jgi:hypothetical protein
VRIERIKLQRVRYVFVGKFDHFRKVIDVLTGGQK